MTASALHQLTPSIRSGVTWFQPRPRIQGSSGCADANALSLANAAASDVVPVRLAWIFFAEVDVALRIDQARQQAATLA